MNLHKAKGLEAPVVFLADPTGSGRHDVEIRVERQGTTVLGHMAIRTRQRHFGRTLLACPREWEDHARLEKRFLDAERDRLLYVAATRAGAMLVVSRASKGRASEASPWRHLADSMASVPDLPEPGPVEPRAPALEAPEPSAATAAVAEIGRRWRRVGTPTYAIETATASAIEDLSPVAPGQDHGAEWGSVVHAILDTAARDPASDLESLARSVLLEHDLSGDLASRALEMVRAVMASEVWRRARRSPLCLTEVPLQMLIPAQEGRLPTVLRGVIDLAFQEGAGWVIVDYKTDASGDLGRLVDRYRGQLEAYGRMWEAATGASVSEKGLLLVRSLAYVTL